MLPKKERLDLKENTAMEKAVFSCPWFRAKARRTPLPKNRYGIVLGASVSKSAVTRHFLKRRIAEEIKKLSTPSASEKPVSCDMILIVSPRITTVPKQRLGQELQGALRAAHEFFGNTKK